MTTLSRRALFGLRRGPDPDEPPRAPSRPLPVLPLLRPPGAVAEATFLERCTKCGECAKACPYGAITGGSPRLGRAAGTPIIDPSNAACRACPDRPCVTACAPRALDPALPTKMGLARIDPGMCLAHRGEFCATCSERCPVPGAVVVTNGRPRIDASVCVGCGACAFSCPAPGNAIAVMPVFERPAAPEQPHV